MFGFLFIVKTLNKKEVITIKPEMQKQITEQNQRLIQHLNSDVHSKSEIHQLISEITGETVDPSTEIRLPFYSDYGHNIHLGRNVFINSKVMFTDLGGITLEDGVLIGPGVSLLTVNHPIDPSKRHELELNPIHIEKNAWVGAESVILPGITIGKNAVVGAGSIVTKDVAPNTIVVGNPARAIRVID